jgi:CDP-glucose 4,6-dehydratase
VRDVNAGRAIGIRNPSAIRPWQHVLDPLSGYLWLGAHLLKSPEPYSGAWNFGPNRNDYFSVKEVVSRFVELWGSGTWQDLSNPGKAVHEAGLLGLCCDKARFHLGWQPALSLVEGLSFTVEWYKRFYADPGKTPMYEMCSRQIREYAEKAKDRGLPWVSQ